MHYFMIIADRMMQLILLVLRCKNVHIFLFEACIMVDFEYCL